MSFLPFCESQILHFGLHQDLIYVLEKKYQKVNFLGACPVWWGFFVGDLRPAVEGDRLIDRFLPLLYIFSID